MIINLNKKLTGETSPGPVASLQPRGSLAPRGTDAAYSGLLECPCTTRKVKLLSRYLLVPASPGRPCAGVSSAVVETAAECEQGAALAHAPNRTAMSRVNDSSLAPGCALSAGAALVFNEWKPPHAPRAEATAGRWAAAPRTEVCRDVTVNAGTIDGVPFQPSVCAAAPESQLLTTHNPVCNVTAYGGGLLCCMNGSLLLDEEQPVPPALDAYHLQYRFYFEEWANATSSEAAADAPVAPVATAAPQRNAFRVWWSTEATNNEYSVVRSEARCADPTTPAANCTYELRSRFRGSDTISFGHGCMCGAAECGCANASRIAEQGGAYELLYAGPHCHAPACEELELWDSDRDELLCRARPRMGDGQPAEPQNERGFVVGIDPCLWGSAAEGLRPPPKIFLDSNLTVVKRVNSTHGHWGVMGLWQMRGAYTA